LGAAWTLSLMRTLVYAWMAIDIDEQAEQEQEQQEDA
jgi:hypothetical protein